MPSRDEWLSLIKPVSEELIVEACSYRGIRYGTYSGPVVLGCSDQHDYVVKAPKHGGLFRPICSDQVMGHVAATISAPVPPVRLVYIPQELVENEPELVDFPAGFAHGSRYKKDASRGRQDLQYVDLPDNRSRFAILALMYGLAGVDGDHQFFYEDGTNLVFSFDHGHFFHGGPEWTIETIRQAPRVCPDPIIQTGCQLSSGEIESAMLSLMRLHKREISLAVGAPPDDWRLTEDERIELAEHLHSRRDGLLGEVE